MPLPPKARKGRGALSNPEGRFESLRVEPVDDGWSQPLPESASQPAGQDETSAEEAFNLMQELPPLETTVLPERAKTIIARNDSPDIPFEQSINPYRGCEHGCIYCISGDTKILMADGSTKVLGDLRAGDEIFGTKRQGSYLRYVKTQVLAHWRTRKPAYRITLGDGTELVASGDHRFLTERGWKFVIGAEQGGDRRPFLTVNNKLMGFGKISSRISKCDSREYRQGYLCGVIRGDGHLGVYRYPPRSGRTTDDQYKFRLAMIDSGALERTADYLHGFGIGTDRFLFQEKTTNRQHCEAIRASARASIKAIESLIEWPEQYEENWIQGFIAGIFDAEGSYSDGCIRIANSDAKLIEVTQSSLNRLGFDTVLEIVKTNRARPMQYVRIRGGLREHLRFFRSCNPSINRKRNIEGQAVKSRADLGVVSIERLSGNVDLFDITTGTGDFIANGVISHNCYARPAHSYVNLSPGLDFETKLFYKPNAAELLEKELRHPKYVCKSISLGSNTDPYQPIERKLRIMRSILEVLQRFRHPLTIVTKSNLVARDIDILADMAKDNLVRVYVSVTTLDPKLKRSLEPRAPAPAARLAAVRALREAGIPAGIMAAPLIPMINDAEIEHILEAAAKAGAQSAGFVMLRLPYEVKDLFREWLQAHYPLRAAHVMSLVQQIRGGRDNDPNFGSRMRGEGMFAQLIERRFSTACARLGLNRERRFNLSTAHFKVPQPTTGQLHLL